MNFYFDKIILWLKNGQQRILRLEPNKVNIITGGSNTGKTAILDIIDYCLFVSKPKVSESIINESTLWYGIVIKINDKNYTIARKSINKSKPSSEYYFSSTGEIPNPLEANNSEDTIKSILETEFSIDKSVKIPYGSNALKAGTKISLRYFLMFNTISGNIIENDNGIFFDKQNETRYRDALPRIFDISLGIETLDNIIKKEKVLELEKEISKLKRKNEKKDKNSEDFKKELSSLIKKAKEYNVIGESLNINESIEELKNAINNIISDNDDIENTREKLEKEKFLIERKVKNIKCFKAEYQSFKSNLNKIDDSLKPIEFLKEKDNHILKTSIYNYLVDALMSELVDIREARKNKTPVDNQVNDVLDALNGKLKSIDEELSRNPSDNKSFENEKEKYFFLGEVKSKLDLYLNSGSTDSEDNSEQIETIKEMIKRYLITEDTSQKKEMVIKLIEEVIADYILLVDDALDNYSTYKPVFDYKNKSLLLRPPKSLFTETVGSSSNHMFLHLFFSLAMHEIALNNNSPFIAPFLVIDQPSRPYYGDEKDFSETGEISVKQDKYKITKAFELLNNFIEVRKNKTEDFQMIVFEHIPTNIFENFENIHLVEEFRNGNALIPNNY